MFLQLHKLDAATRMVNLALERIPLDQAKRREDMLSMQLEIQAAREEASKAATRLASQRAYHFGKLPVEIANTIFSVILADDHAAVVKLARVCKTWRMAIINTPAFWKTLVLTSKHPRRKIGVWKERSRNRIQHLSLHNSFADDPSALEALDSLSTQHMQSLTLHEFQLSVLHQHLPSAASQVIHSLRGWPMSRPMSLVGSLQKDDNQTAFRCQRVTLPRGTTSVDWFQLSDSLVGLESCTLAGLENGDMPHLLWLLHKNPCMSHLDVSQFFPTSDDHVPDRETPPKITLAQLSALHLSQTHPHTILSRLALPSLNTLQISRCSGPFYPSLRDLAHGLTSLSIQYSAIRPRDLVDVIEAATELQSLQLVCVGNNTVSAVLEALSRSPSSPTEGSPPRPCCPGLQHLDCSGNPDVKGGPIMRLVKLRLPAHEDGQSQEDAVLPSCIVQPLLSLTINDCPSVPADVLPWLREKVTSVSCIYMTKKQASWKR